MATQGLHSSYTIQVPLHEALPDLTSTSDELHMLQLSLTNVDKCLEEWDIMPLEKSTLRRFFQSGAAMHPSPLSSFYLLTRPAFCEDLRLPLRARAHPLAEPASQATQLSIFYAILSDPTVFPTPSPNATRSPLRKRALPSCSSTYSPVADWTTCTPPLTMVARTACRCPRRRCLYPASHRGSHGAGSQAVRDSCDGMPMSDSNVHEDLSFSMSMAAVFSQPDVHVFPRVCRPQTFVPCMRTSHVPFIFQNSGLDDLDAYQHVHVIDTTGEYGTCLRPK
ncbi:hypothetical protein H4582DRAFT_2132984 [Lactarius indigo]|nr:hypothetical protein H4582DRAFT_2132984 [Lactarius indigo]